MNQADDGMVREQALAETEVNQDRAVTTSEPEYGETQVGIDLAKRVGADGSAHFHFTQERIEEIRLHIREARLPKRAYLECTDPKRKTVVRYRARDFERLASVAGGWFAAPIPGNTVSVRLVYPRGVGASPDDTLHVDYVRYVVQPMVTKVIGEDERVPIESVHYTMPDTYERSHAIGQMRAGGWGTGWMLSSGNFLMTNYHVIGGVGPVSGVMRFNYQTPYDDPDATPENYVDIPLNEVVRSGGASGTNDWSLLTLDPVQYREAGIQQVFGGLRLLNEVPAVGRTMYVAGHGDATPKRIGYTYDGEPSWFLSASASLLTYNCDTSGGNSGSPIQVADSNYAIGVHRAGESGSSPTYNIGTPTTVFWPSISDLVPDATEHEVLGTANVLRGTFEFPSFPKVLTQSFSGQGLFFNALHADRLTHDADYSLLHTIGQNAAGDEVDFYIRLSLTTVCGTTNLLAPTSCTADDTCMLNLWFDLDDNPHLAVGEVVTGWAPLTVHQDGALLYNLMNDFSCMVYDPYTSPFGSEAEVTELTLYRDQTVSVQRTDARAGFVAVYTGEGPTSLVSSASGYTEAEVPVRTNDGDEAVVKLYAVRTNACSTRPMNVSVACSGGAPSTLQVSYRSVDNPNVPAGRYYGLFPVMARDWNDSTVAAPILINLDISIGQVPVADAGNDRTVIATGNYAYAYALDGSASQDPSGTGLTYQWSVASGPFTLKNATQATASAIVPANTTGVTVYQLTVTNGLGETSSATTTVTAVAPLVTLSGSTAVDYGGLASFAASANFSSPTYTWELQSAAGEVVAEGSGASWATPDTLAPGSYAVVVLAYNASAERTASASQTLTVAAPVPVANAGADRTVVATYNTSFGYALSGSGEDPLGEGLAYQWTVDNTQFKVSNANQAVAQAVVPVGVVGTAVYTLTVTDALGTSASDTATVTSVAPSVAIGGDNDVTQGIAPQFSATANFNRIDSYTWTLTDQAGEVVDSGSGASWTATADLELGTYTVAVVVVSSYGQRQAEASRSVVVHR